MSYFSRFPILSGYVLNDTKYNVIDITKRNFIPNDLKDDSNLYFEYLIKEGERPEILADRLYNNADLFWVFLLINDIFDVDNQWPVSQQALDRYCARVYTNPSAVHHYESISTGSVVDSTHVTYDRVAVSNYQHEERKNDSKRKIKVVFPEFIGLIQEYHKR